MVSTTAVAAVLRDLLPTPEVSTAVNGEAVGTSRWFVVVDCCAARRLGAIQELKKIGQNTELDLQFKRNLKA
jgi:hypothetical protein